MTNFPTSSQPNSPSASPTPAENTGGLPLSDRRGVVTICLLAAFADGGKSDSERARLKDVFDSIGAENAQFAGQMPAIYQRVLMRQVTVADAAKDLTTPEARTLAYEMAVCVCEADDALSTSEKAFLASLSSTLGTTAQVAQHAHTIGDELLQLDLGPAGNTGNAAPLAAAGAIAGTAMVAAAAPSPTSLAPQTNSPQAATPQVDPLILKSAIAAAAIELLPQGLASAAIIPLQMNMVYRVGKAHGISLDRGHIKDLLATVGVGITSQIVEGYARKALGGLLGSVTNSLGLGRSVGNIASRAVNHGTGPLITFCTTYALGQVAKQYYAGGRSFAAIDLKALFTRESERAKTLYAEHKPAIERQTGTLNASSIRSLLTGTL